jgi:hypothetical protein
MDGLVGYGSSEDDEEPKEMVPTMPIKHTGGGSDVMMMDDEAVTEQTKEQNEDDELDYEEDDEEYDEEAEKRALAELLEAKLQRQEGEAEAGLMGAAVRHPAHESGMCGVCYEQPGKYACPCCQAW